MRQNRSVKFSTFTKSIFKDFGDSIKRVQGNPRVVAISQPFWSIPFNLYNPFMTQYMLSLGLNNEQVGLISSIGLVFGMVLSFFSGYITDRMGRRWALLTFDLVTWCLGCLLWGLAQNFAWFLAAGIANAFVRIVAVPYGCVLVEGTPPENRLSVYSVLNLAAILANFCAPLMIVFINPLGLVPAMRAVLIASSIIYTITFIIRHIYLKDTEIAIKRKEESKQETPFSAIIDYKRILKNLINSKVLLILIIMRALHFVQNNMRNTYLSVTIIQGLGFHITVMSLVSILTGVVTLFAQLLIMPKLVGKNPQMPLLISLFIGILSTVMLFIAPNNNLAFLICVIILNSAGLVVIHMLIETLVANTMPDADRASLLGLATIFMVLVSAPFQYLAGVLADIPEIGPRLPQLIIAFIMTVSFVLALGLRRISDDKASIV